MCQNSRAPEELTVRSGVQREDKGGVINMKTAILATIVAAGFALTTPAPAGAQQGGGEPKGSPGGSERQEKGASPGGSEDHEKGGERREESGRHEERGERGGHERHRYHGRWYEYGEGECWNKVGPVFIWTCGADDDD